MASKTLVKCAHPPCQCLVESEQSFCSSACSSARAAASAPCACGHTGCADDQILTGDLDEDESDALATD